MSETYSVHFETLGCKLNQIESESAANSFFRAGFSVNAKPASAGTPIHEETRLCIINTCTVTTKAEQKARRIIRLLLEKYPNAAVIVTGCYAQVESAEIKAICPPRIAVLSGTKKDTLAQVPDFVSANPDFSVSDLEQFFLTHQISNATFTLSTETFMQHSRASIKIQDGCANSCAFCRIHIARGKPVSLDPQKVLERISALEKTGQQEVVITGVNLTQYKGFVEESGKYMDIAQLLEYLIQNTRSIKFRISSLYPERVDESLCRILADRRVQPHFHLSVQSGSDSILKAMGRKYLSDQVLLAAERLRTVKPNCFLACDIITGFPGESDADFEETVRIVRECNFSWVHVFPFSPRPGTEAYKMKPKVSESVSRQRAAKLTDLALAQKKQWLESLVGKDCSAIVEKKRMTTMRAVTENFVHVQIENSDDYDKEFLGGKEVRLRITEILPVSSQTEAVEAMSKIISIPEMQEQQKV